MGWGRDYSGMEGDYSWMGGEGGDYSGMGGDYSGMGGGGGATIVGWGEGKGL